MASPKPIAFQFEQQDQTLTGGQPTGNITFIALPEATFIALSDEAAKRGMNVAQALAQALDEFLKNHPPKG